MAFRNAYLSGWEFNRLTELDPFVSKPSSLPGSVLWGGSSFLWLFETVYCTAESLEGERRSGAELGWTSGQIYQELESLGILRPIDWRLDLPSAAVETLKIRHARLRAAFPVDQLRSMIRSGSTVELEELKLSLLRPILDTLGCLSINSPSSIPSWISTADEHENCTSVRLVERALDLIVAPLRISSNMPGLAVCRPPGTGVSGSAIQSQQQLVRQLESVLMPDMLLMEGVFEGSDGYAPYIEALAPHRVAYQPINDQLESDWRENRPRLLELRRLAQKYLWPSLHNEWLPRLEAEGASYINEFARQLSRAVRESRFASLLNCDTTLALGVILATTTGLGIAGHDYLGLPEALSVPLAMIGGAAATYGIETTKSQRGSLRTFYQRANRLSHPTQDAR